MADADAAHVIVDLLVRLQGQVAPPLDPAFAERDDKLAEVGYDECARHCRQDKACIALRTSGGLHAADLVHSLHAVA
jgi:hypothetical protein